MTCTRSCTWPTLPQTLLLRFSPAPFPVQVTVGSGIQVDSRMRTGKYYMLKDQLPGVQWAPGPQQEMWIETLTQALFTSKTACAKTGFDLGVYFLKSSNKPNHIFDRKIGTKVCYSEVSDEGLSSHLSRNYKEKSMAALAAKGNPSFFCRWIFLYFISRAFPLWTGFKHNGNPLTNETQPKPAGHCQPWKDDGRKMAKAMSPTSLCLQHSLLLAAGVCVREVSVARASLPDCFSTGIRDAQSALPTCLLGHITPNPLHPWFQ